MEGKVYNYSHCFFMAIVAFAYQFTVKKTWTSLIILSSPSQADLSNYEAIASSIEPTDDKNVIASREFQRIVFATFKTYLSVTGVPNDMKLTVKPTETGQLEVKLSSFSAEQSYSELKKIINEANNSAVSYYVEDLNAKLAAEKNRLKDLISAQEEALTLKAKRRLVLLENALRIANIAEIKENQLKDFDNVPDDLLYMLGSNNLKAMIDVLQEQPSSYDEKLYSSTLALSVIEKYHLKDNDMKSIFIVKEPTIPTHADHSQKLVYIILAAILGFGLGILIILIRDFFMSFKRKQSV